MDDELIEAMARCIHAELSRANVMAYLDMPDTTPETLARSLLPIIRAHLEPTSEMLANTVTSDGRMRIMEFTTIEERGEAFMVPRYIWRAMLAASPIGE